LFLVLFLRQLARAVRILYQRSAANRYSRFGIALLFGVMATVVMFNDYQMSNYAGIVLLAVVYRAIRLMSQASESVAATP
jgi:hypothetical protein